MKKIITFGVFDLLHYGHILLFKKCKMAGDYLIVAVQSDDQVTVNKPNCNLVLGQNERVELVKSISYVDEVVIYNQIDETIQDIDFDILAVGPDQNNQHFKKAIEFVKSLNKEVIVLPRTENISSSKLREKIAK